MCFECKLLRKGERVRIAAITLTLVGVAAGLVSKPPPLQAQTDAAPVTIVVVREHGGGSAVLAQPYLDRFVAIAAKENGWAEAEGEYFNDRRAAEAFIKAENPHYGIFSVPVFLTLRASYRLTVIGRVAVSLAGGKRYSLISKTATDLGGCKGKTLASDHTEDPRFIERVVAGGKFAFSDFELVKTRRPLQTIMKVIADAAACALVDDAQMAELPRIDGSADLRVVWQSAQLPPMVVTAFPAAPAAERQRFQKHLPDLCGEAEQNTCAEVGIVSLRTASAADYAAVVAAYGNQP
jgi:hypothetical protein